MSDTLCRWLNDELRLSQVVDPKTFAKNFCSGYLLGEILHKHQLQNDFSMFTKKHDSISKMNNFSRLEPTLQYLGISFNKNTAQELMQEKHGVATELLYQLYVSLQRKKKQAPNLEHKCFRTYSPRKAAIVQVTNPPPCKSLLNIKMRKHHQQQKAQQAQSLQTVQTEIAQFEANREKLATRGFSSSSRQSCEIPRGGAETVLKPSCKYLQDIQQRVRENVISREQRERRHDIFLVEQLSAHKAEEEALREDQLVKRLTCQTQQEQRLAAQLLQIRSQKEVMQKNRLLREQQYQQRRARDFQEALEKERALAQQERAKVTRKELELSNRIAAERAQSRYKKHSMICKDILEQTVDLATKVGEYQLLAGNLIPEKLMREWKGLMLSELPLCEPSKRQGSEFSTPTDPVELKNQELLGNHDYDDYTNMVGEWAWPEEAGETKTPPTNNNILGHVIGRLRSIVHPPITEPSKPSFPDFTLKACVLGKFCSGKSTCLAMVAEGHGIYVLSADTLIKDTLNAYHNGEELSGRAMHGATAEKELKSGNTIPNELLVDIITEAIRQIPAQSGWILDGFPMDITQAHLLEKALGGAVDEGTVVVDNRRILAADPNPPKPPLPPGPVLDLALLLEVPDECVVRRALSHTDTDTAAPSSCTNDKTFHLAQIQHRMTAFQDTWPELETWFGGQQNILACVDADVEEEELYKRVESVLQQVMRKREEALAPSPVEDVALNSQNAPDSSPSATPVDETPCLRDEASGLTESHSSPNDDKAQSMTTSNSPQERSKKVSSPSGTHEDIQQVPTNPSQSASPCPGSSSWVYVDEPIPPEIPEYLSSHWDTVCDSYVNNIKAVMQLLRSPSTAIINDLYNIREEFKHYLGRPGLKQEFVSQWQKNFNSFGDDVREDIESKAELHLKLDELCERLWDIGDKRKEEDEQKKAALMGEGWFKEHIAVLINHHSTLMQVELDRFQATLHILRVYYLSMYNRVLPEQEPSLVCVPLLSAPEIEDDKKDQGKRRPESSMSVSKTKGQDQTEPVKKLNFNYEEILTEISKLVSAAAQHFEPKEQKEKVQEKTPSRASKSAKKTKKKPSKIKKDQPSPRSTPSPVAASGKKSEESHDQAVKKKIHTEFAAALAHEENAAKVRIALVKGHGLMTLQSLQSRTEQNSSSMQESLEAHYLAEMKSIEQLSEVVQLHIEAAAKLRNEMVLEGTDFYLNGGYQMLVSLLPPLRLPSLEKPMQSILTITHLESLHRQLCTVAPAGLMSSLEFSSLLNDYISVNKDLPEPWTNSTETQVSVIVSLLKDDHDLIDWRLFLLSAALPWPIPSLTQLLAVFARFKAADCGNMDYINEEQYLQTELWFSNDSVQSVPKDPSEPLPYDHLANLSKHLVQIFKELGYEPEDHVPISLLSQHPFIQGLMETTAHCQLIVRFKSSALCLSRIHKSHPVPPNLRLVQWMEHILHSGGGSHLRPASLTQPWYQMYLLGLLLLFSLGLLGPVVLCWTYCKNKQSRDKYNKIQ